MNRDGVGQVEKLAAEQLASGSEDSLREFERMHGSSGLTQYAWRLRQARAENLAMRPMQPMQTIKQKATINNILQGEVSERAAVFDEDMKELRAVVRKGEEVEAYTKRTGDKRLAAVVATALQPGVDKLHIAYEEYSEEKSPLGIAKMLHKYVLAAHAAGINEETMVYKLIDNEELIAKVTGLSNTNRLPNLNSLDKLPVVKKACSPWTMIARAADLLSQSYMSIPKVQRAKCAPGVFACQGMSITPMDGDDSSVVFMAGTSERDHWPAGYACLKRAKYACAAEEAGLGPGTPFATGRVVDKGTPGAVELSVRTRTDEWRATKNKWVLVDTEPRWEYSYTGKVAVLKVLFRNTRAIMASTGEAEAELAAAAQYRSILKAELKAHNTEALEEFHAVV
jgi:hypothetical protein